MGKAETAQLTFKILKKRKERKVRAKESEINDYKVKQAIKTRHRWGTCEKKGGWW